MPPPGLINDDSLGLERGTGLIWLAGGLGGGGFEPTPAGEMITESGVAMVTEGNVVMVTEAS